MWENVRRGMAEENGESARVGFEKVEEFRNRETGKIFYRFIPYGVEMDMPDGYDLIQTVEITDEKKKKEFMMKERLE